MRRPRPVPSYGYLGVDPGRSSGGVAYITDTYTQTWKLNTLTDKDLYALFQHVASAVNFCVLERVNSMPGQGVASSFKFGSSFGELKMALVASSIPFELVSPVKWQTALKCRSGGDKNVTKEAAQRLFPTHKVTHANADALLLAEYARRLYKERR